MLNGPSQANCIKQDGRIQLYAKGKMTVLPVFKYEASLI